MKIIKYLILLFLAVNLNAYENYTNINQLNRNIQMLIESDLKNLNGYLSGVILKELYFKDGIYLQEFNRCNKKQKADFISGNIKTRIYFIKCYKVFNNRFYSKLKENNINNKIKILNKYLANKYNAYIYLKCKILGINPNRYYIKSLNYNIDNVGFRREWYERVTQISALWSELLSEVDSYDRTWGFLDNLKLLSEIILSDTTARGEHLKNMKRLYWEIYRQTKLLLDNLTEAIKDKFREDVESGLENIYE